MAAATGAFARNATVRVFVDDRETKLNPSAMMRDGKVYVGLRAVAKALGELPEAPRMALELAYFGGFSHSEIAERLDAPPGTVKARIRQGMLRMRDLLRDFAAAGLIADTEE